jgi:hypothetical protein
MKRKTSLKILSIYLGAVIVDATAINVAYNLAVKNPNTVWLATLAKYFSLGLFWLFIPVVGSVLVSAVLKATAKFDRRGYDDLQRSILRPLLWDEIWDNAPRKARLGEGDQRR